MGSDVATWLGLLRSVAIYHGRPWRARALRRFYQAFVGPGDLAFDIGAHVGNRTRALRAAGARVVAVEPQPALLSFLARTLPRDGVTLVGEAVGDRPGTAMLNISRRHPTVTTLSAGWIDQVRDADGFRHVAWDDRVEVPVTTLDSLIARFGRPRFCKIDVEGFEAAILSGLGQPIPVVAFEYLPAALGVAEACIDRLAALGPYRFNLVRGEGHRFAAERWVDAAAAREVMREAATDGRSGDVYARLDG